MPSFPYHEGVSEETTRTGYKPISHHPLSTTSSPSAASISPAEMTTIQISPIGRPRSSNIHRDPAICPTDDDAIVPDRSSAKGIHSQQHQNLNKKSWEYIIKSGIAGGLAGCAAKTLVGPLDRVKILFQTSNPQYAKYSGSWVGLSTALRGIYSQDGTRGLFRGHSATLLRIFPYAGIKFLAYEQIRGVLIPSSEYETPVRRFSSGALAGCVSVFFTYPLELIRVRLAFETKRDSRSSLTGIIRRIYGEQPRNLSTMANGEAIALHTVSRTPFSGLPNFFRGFTATLSGMLPYAGASFLVHDTMTDVMRLPRLSPYTTIVGSEGGSKNPNKRPQLKYWAELTTGGVAGFVSQTVSYPLEVIRRHMQVGGVVGDGHRLRMSEVSSRILAERGWRGFFVGLGIGYIKMVPMTATSFLVYERAKWYLGI